MRRPKFFEVPLRIRRRRFSPRGTHIRINAVSSAARRGIRFRRRTAAAIRCGSCGRQRRQCRCIHARRQLNVVARRVRNAPIGAAFRHRTRRIHDRGRGTINRLLYLACFLRFLFVLGRLDGFSRGPRRAIRPHGAPYFIRQPPPVGFDDGVGAGEGHPQQIGHRCDNPEIAFFRLLLVFRPFQTNGRRRQGPPAGYRYFPQRPWFVFRRPRRGRSFLRFRQFLNFPRFVKADHRIVSAPHPPQGGGGGDRGRVFRRRQCDQRQHPQRRAEGPTSDGDAASGFIGGRISAG